jgi:hypothetical protein
MKKFIGVLAWTLLVVGGLNWGLVGIFGFDLVASIFGDMTGASRVIYSLVGLSAVYMVIMPSKKG